MVRIDTAASLRRGLAKVHNRLGPLDRKSARDGDRIGAKPVIVHPVREFAIAVRDGFQSTAHHILGIVLQGSHLFCDDLNSVPFDCFPHPALADPVRGNLCPEVAQAFIRRAHVRQDHGKQTLVVFAIADETNRGNAQALLVDLLRQRHRARCHPADIGMMGPRYQVKGWLSVAPDENSRNRSNVRQMRATSKRVVEKIDLAILEIKLAGDCLDRRRHGAEVGWHVISHGDGPALGVV